MSPIEQQTETPAMPGGGRQRPLGARRAHRGAAAAAVAIALAAAGCGGDDGGSGTTAGGSGAAAPTTTPTTGGQTTPPAPDGDHGIAGQSAERILDAARGAARAADSVRVDGDLGEVAMELRLLRGRGATGRMSREGIDFELVVVDGAIHLRGGEEFFAQVVDRTSAARLGGRWLRVPADDPRFELVGQLAEMERLLRAATHPGDGPLRVGAVETVDGREAVGVSGSNATLFVATTGEPLPLKLVGSAARPGEVAFSDWNEPVELTAPADAVDLAELPGGAGR
ncbi:hypothetical protein [Conexibacter arvalis]|uniref:Lipoprotein n=1 Tax=Conexibacter arvalis TaxID=912552 RepID=A0A840ICH7_9ACTN|nr:hypothetical protein [Conexibacter arvalis]MBB4662035.1 hypothetical protein [Conexibacter arvalis]